MAEKAKDAGATPSSAIYHRPLYRDGTPPGNSAAQTGAVREIGPIE